MRIRLHVLTVFARLVRAILSLALVLLPSAADAHTGAEVTVGLWSGMLHPLTGLDHTMAMVAVGIWGAQLGRPAIWLLPVTFPLVMALGGVVGIRQVPFPFVEVGIAASAVVLGAMVLGAVRASLPVATAVVGFFAVCHGYAHGAELPHAANPFAYGVGFVLVTGLLHVCGIAIGLLKRWPAGALAMRACGAVIGVAGLYLLGGHLG
ncbi:MAG: HupE/UreJ family protein [Acidimicrobiia bacterium]|nr:HupE/UreJ family protein [Acidimicrobiia bacterium]